MGAYLSAPITEKESSDGENGTFKYGVASMQGWRTNMEDAHAALLELKGGGGQPVPTGYFAVFDGHGGKEVAKFAAKYLAGELVKSAAWQRGDLGAALQDTYLHIDELLLREDARAELAEMAGGEPEDGGRQVVQIGDDGLPDYIREALVSREEELPEYIREILVARIRAQAGGRGGEEDDWGGDEGEDPDFDPLVGQDGEEGAKGGRRREDSEGHSEESGEGPSDSGGDDMVEGSPSPDAAAAANGVASPPDEEYKGPAAGCTAVVALVRNNQLVVANAGDSRCVCSRAGKAVAMTHDHKPTDEEEHTRIQKAGGFISDGRVNGSLNLSRALGDLEYKRDKTIPPSAQMITAFPEVRTLQLQPGDEFLILACDGIWDVLTNQEAVDFVRERLQQGMEPRAICEAMCDACLAPDTDGSGQGCDNMSAMVVVLKDFAGKQPPAAAAADARQE